MRTLKVKCPTWQHLETFYGRKLRKDRTLTLQVPFRPEEGARVHLGLQLPDDKVVEIEGTVIGVKVGQPGEKNAMRLFLHGMSKELLQELKAAVAEARRGQTIDPHAVGTRGDMSSAAPSAEEEALSMPLPLMAPPAAMPEDAPVNEVVEQLLEPTADEVSEYEREVFLYLDRELRRMRECAAHEVLGVAPDVDVAQIRAAYFELSKRFHPDLFARYRSRATLHMAQELFIHINKAYDRLRDTLVAAGRAIVAGPALLPHDGWLAGIDDMAGSDEPTMAEIEPPSALTAATTESDNASIEAEVLGLIAEGQLEDARAAVAAALHEDPRDRRMRALYHVISGQELLTGGENMAAATQFEAALAHDRDCELAQRALDELNARGEHSGLLPRSLR